MEKTVRIRHPELVEIDDNVIIDDFNIFLQPCRFLIMYIFSAGIKLIGGRGFQFQLEVLQL